MRLGLALVAIMAVCVLGCGRPPDGAACDARTTASDPQNCGRCGNVCATPLHATAVCQAGTCSLGSCEPGWMNLEPTVYGCEAQCRDASCTAPAVGGSAELPTSGNVLSTFASSSASYDGVLQRNREYINFAVSGESTPLPATGVTQASDRYSNIPGFNAVLH